MARLDTASNVVYRGQIIRVQVCSCRSLLYVNASHAGASLLMLTAELHIVFNTASQIVLTSRLSYRLLRLRLLHIVLCFRCLLPTSIDVSDVCAELGRLKSKMFCVMSVDHFSPHTGTGVI